jgi:hypothetical protein
MVIVLPMHEPYTKKKLAWSRRREASKRRRHGSLKDAFCFYPDWGFQLNSRMIPYTSLYFIPGDAINVSLSQLVADQGRELPDKTGELRHSVPKAQPNWRTLSPQFHVLHGDPFKRAVSVVFTTE